MSAKQNKDKIIHPRRSNIAIASDALEKNNWPSAIAFNDCAVTRAPCGGCCNNLRCRNVFDSSECNIYL